MPREGDVETNWRMACQFAQKYLVEEQGLVVDLAYHDGIASDGGKQEHVHCLTSTRSVTPEGFHEKKNLNLDKEATLKKWKMAWEEIHNDTMEEIGQGERAIIDMRSYKERGMDKQGEPKLGHHAGALEKRGVQTRAGEHLRLVKHENAVISDVTIYDPATSDDAVAIMTTQQKRTSDLMALARQAIGRG